MAKGFFKTIKPAVAQVLTTGCSTCGLASAGCLTPKMEPTGQGRKRIYVLAEAPGETEDHKGVQLIGKVGQRVRQVFREHGIDLDRDCRKTNSVRCRPTGNRTPTKEEVAHCRKHVFDDITKVKPRVILLFGGAAVQSLLGNRWNHDSDFTISRWRGLAIPDQELNAWVCPTFHPSYIERSERDPAVGVLWLKDIARAFSLVDVPLPKAPEPDINILKEDQVEDYLLTLWRRGKARDMVLESCPFAGLVPGTPKWKEYWQQHPRQQAKMLQHRDNYLPPEKMVSSPATIALDYETTGLKPYGREHRVVSCSVAESPELVSCWMWPQERSGIETYWRELMQSESVRKIGANMKFEQVWTRAKFGHEILGWDWDVILAGKVLDNRPGNSNVAFQTYTRLGILGFKDNTQQHLRAADSNALNQISKIPTKDLLLRNALDSAYEYGVALKQREEMGYEC